MSSLARSEQHVVRWYMALIALGMVASVSYFRPDTSTSSAIVNEQVAPVSPQVHHRRKLQQVRDTIASHYSDSATNTIRSWGCQQSLSPLVMVHIPKTGGDSLRARIALSATNATRLRWDGTDKSSFPLAGTSDTTYRASTFCNSGMPHHRPMIQERESDGVWVCNAETPIGHMIGCPVRYFPGRPPRFHSCYCEPFSETCDLIYAGHNFVGSELHWLPAPYLQQWWTTLNEKHHSSTTTENNAAMTAVTESISLHLQRIAIAAIGANDHNLGKQHGKSR